MFTKYINDIKAIFRDKYVQAFIGIFSIIFGLVKSLSEFVYDKDEVNVDVLQSGIYAIICYLLLNFAYYIVTRDYKVKPVEIKSPCKLWWTFFAILFLSYIICWMTYGTALISQDNMLIYYWGIKLSCQHPIFYTAFVLLSKNIGVWLGSMLYGVWFYTIIQAITITTILTIVLVWIFRLQIPRVLKYLIASYYILIPIFSIYALNMEKDPLFSIAIMTMTISLYSIIKLNRKKDWIIFWISIFFVEILRHNGFYITIGTIIVLLCNFKQMYRNALIALCIVIITHIGQDIAMSAVGSKQLFQEKVAVPIQQIAAVVKNDGLLTEEQKDFINQIMPLENLRKAYNPYASDSIKWAGVKHGFNKDFLETHQNEFLRHWWAILPNNIDIYIKAYLKVSLGWWAPYYFKNIGYKSFWSPNRAELSAFAEKNNLEINPIIHEKIKEYLEKYYDLSNWYPREGMLFWLLIFSALIYYLKQHSLKDMIIYLPCFILWLTIMIAAPKARGFRYILAFAYLLPFFVALLFAEEYQKQEKVTLSEITKKRIKLFIKMAIVTCLLLYGIWYFTIGHPIKARIDLSVPYDENEAFVALNNDKAIEEAEWMNKFGRRGIVIQENGREYSFILIPFENTDIKMVLRGPDERDTQGKRYERWVKYTDFRIDGKKILLESIDTWHDKPFVYILKAEKNHLYKINLKWRKK